MPNKNHRLVDRQAAKKGVGWLVNDQEGKVCGFTNANATGHALWVVVETRPLRGSVQPVIRRIFMHIATDAWEAMLTSGGRLRGYQNQLPTPLGAGFCLPRNYEATGFWQLL